MGNVATGATFSRRYCDTFFNTFFQKYFSRSKVLIRKDCRTENIFQDCQFTSYLLSDKSDILMMTVETQTYQPRLRQICKMQMFRKRLFPCGYLHGKSALSVVGDHQNSMFYMYRRWKTLSQGRKHRLRHHCGCLERHPGH